MGRYLSALAFLLCGCATAPPPSPSSPPPPAPESRMETQAAAPPVIRRAELLAVLDTSPGYFLQHVQTEPRFDHGQFAGWRLVHFFPGDPRFVDVDLHAGDVVTRVNGQSIERPDQFLAVWTSLRSARELVVELDRAGQPQTLRFTISDK